ncbi:FAD:protein FMN transferase [Marinomonas sp. UCMA 3892]|uniref:FAD:protein FMN transferase n=1 Tax=Gammaproteobacteria TaxID=1236 RepID=UPI00146D32AF|nr:MULTISPECIES: FAD:protein FMN transferase [Gammaproteobacteria]MCS6193224.1 FAD:protein FMN transferase [Shewanella baltica]NLU97977.1 FAD:protein FMN transferase [Marinomonas sp. UCMA 3892]|tara:strand:- start:28241 stop:29239 length:999 start_codon:yes stop_codon:yes gene_type:complete
MKWLLTFILLIMLEGCQNPPNYVKLEGLAQGTSWHVTFWSKENINNAEINREIDQQLAEIDLHMSTYRPDSVISRFNTMNSTMAVGDDILGLIQIAKDVTKKTDGCYDLTIKPLFDLWGFTNNQLTIPTESALQQTLTYVGLHHLTIANQTLSKDSPEVHLDLSSIGQGYSVGKVADVLKRYNIDNYLVEIGGEMVVHGTKLDGSAWKIAIEKPLPEQRTMQKVLLIDFPQAIMTSGTYRHYFDHQGQRYSHIIDARTGKPVTHNTVSVTVLASDPSWADAWSTALLCLGSQEGIAVANGNGIKALFIDDNKGVLKEIKTDSYKKMKNIELN